MFKSLLRYISDYKVNEYNQKLEAGDNPDNALFQAFKLGLLRSEHLIREQQEANPSYLVITIHSKPDPIIITLPSTYINQIGNQPDIELIINKVEDLQLLEDLVFYDAQDKKENLTNIEKLKKIHSLNNQQLKSNAHGTQQTCKVSILVENPVQSIKQIERFESMIKLTNQEINEAFTVLQQLVTPNASILIAAIEEAQNQKKLSSLNKLIEKIFAPIKTAIDKQITDANAQTRTAALQIIEKMENQLQTLQEVTTQQETKLNKFSKKMLIITSVICAIATLGCLAYIFRNSKFMFNILSIMPNTTRIAGVDSVIKNCAEFITKHSHKLPGSKPLAYFLALSSAATLIGARSVQLKVNDKKLEFVDDIISKVTASQVIVGK